MGNMSDDDPVTPRDWPYAALHWPNLIIHTCFLGWNNQHIAHVLQYPVSDLCQTGLGDGLLLSGTKEICELTLMSYQKSQWIICQCICFENVMDMYYKKVFKMTVIFFPRMMGQFNCTSIREQINFCWHPEWIIPWAEVAPETGIMAKVTAVVTEHHPHD